MIQLSNGGPRWSTSSSEGPADETPDELFALATQLSNCKRSRGRLLRVRSAVAAAESSARARFITTLVLVAVAVAASWLLS
jgi:hypothetical protein